MCTCDVSAQPKRWDAVLQRPDLDYGELFADGTGTLPGLTAWQIENFCPIEVEDSESTQLKPMGVCLK